MWAALPYVTRVGGGLLVLAGADAAYYGWYEVRVLRGQRVEDPIIDTAIGWQSDLTRVVADLNAAQILGALAILAMATALLGRRARVHRSRDDMVAHRSINR